MPFGKAVGDSIGLFPIAYHTTQHYPNLQRTQHGGEIACIVILFIYLLFDNN